MQQPTIFAFGSHSVSVTPEKSSPFHAIDEPTVGDLLGDFEMPRTTAPATKHVRFEEPCEKEQHPYQTADKELEGIYGILENFSSNLNDYVDGDVNARDGIDRDMERAKKFMDAIFTKMQALTGLISGLHTEGTEFEETLKKRDQEISMLKQELKEREELRVKMHNEGANLVKKVVDLEQQLRESNGKIGEISKLHNGVEHHIKNMSDDAAKIRLQHKKEVESITDKHQLKIAELQSIIDDLKHKESLRVSSEVQPRIYAPSASSDFAPTDYSRSRPTSNSVDFSSRKKVSYVQYDPENGRKQHKITQETVQKHKVSAKGDAETIAKAHSVGMFSQPQLQPQIHASSAETLPWNKSKSQWSSSRFQLANAPSSSNAITSPYYPPTNASDDTYDW